MDSEDSSIQKPPQVPERARPGGEARESQRETLMLSPNAMELRTGPMPATLERGNDDRQWCMAHRKGLVSKGLAIEGIKAWIAARRWSLCSRSPTDQSLVLLSRQR